MTGWSADRGAKRTALGRYELLERIGLGGMAEIFRARLTGPEGFEKIVVIKRLLSSHAEDPNLVQMFVEEAKLAAAASHDNVAEVYELGRGDDGRWFIALEHVPGSDLAKLVRAATERNLRVPVWLTLHVFAEVLEGLAFLHDLRDARGVRLGVVHRDVTPANVLLSEHGHVKLADFGVARFLGKTSVTLAGQLKGKIGYMAPEQIENRPIDARADLFSVGVGLWECLGQKVLFEGTDPEVMMKICEGRRPHLAEVVTDVPPELDSLVQKSLAVEPGARFQSALELQAAILDVLQRLRPSIRRSEVRRTLAHLLPAVKQEAPTATVPKPLVPDSDSTTRTVDEDDEDETAAMRAELRKRMGAAQEDSATEALRERGDGVWSSLEDSNAETTRKKVEPVTVGADRRPPTTPPSRPEPRAQPGREDSLATSAARISLFVRGGGGPIAELDYGPALDRLRDLAERGTASISADGRRWMDATELSRLAGLDFVSSTADAPSNVTVVSSLEECSIVGAFAILGRERHTGTLAVARMTPLTGEWYELDLIDGKPTRVATNVATMQLPAILVRERLIAADRIPALVATAIREHRPLEVIVEEEVGKKLDRGGLATARLAALLGWERADYAFSVDYKAKRTPPFARSLLGPALAVAERTLSLEGLLARLGDRARARLHPTSTWAETIADLELDARQATIAERLRSGRPVTELLDAEPQSAKTLLALAWILIEAGSVDAPGLR